MFSLRSPRAERLRFSPRQSCRSGQSRQLQGEQASVVLPSPDCIRTSIERAVEAERPGRAVVRGTTTRSSERAMAAAFFLYSGSCLAMARR